VIANSLQGGLAFKEKFQNDPEFAAAWTNANHGPSLEGLHKMLKKRMRCDECGMISHPQGIGHHQTSFGHSGKTMLVEEENDDQ
jgi:hypothetical protein